MTESVFGCWRIEHDSDATAMELKDAVSQGPGECRCAPCLNFVAARQQAFPPEFLSILEVLGIPQGSEVEVYHNGPMPNGRHSYGGWFHFVGQVVEDPETVTEIGDRFCYYFRNDAQLVRPKLKAGPVGQLEFSCELPWLMDLPREP